MKCCGIAVMTLVATHMRVVEAFVRPPDFIGHWKSTVQSDSSRLTSIASRVEEKQQGEGHGRSNERQTRYRSMQNAKAIIRAFYAADADKSGLVGLNGA